jgi:Phage tail lysozyme/Peptidase_C39 like family
MKILKSFLFLFLSLLLLFSGTGITYALSEDELKSIYSETTFYDPNSYNDCVIPSNAQSNSTVYVVGDSIAVGLQQNKLTEKLEASGYTNISYNAHVGRGIYSGGNDNYPALKALKDDTDFIKKAGTVLIVLGTNPDNYEKGIPEFMKELNSINGSARKFWVNVGVTRNDLKPNMNEVNKLLVNNSKDFNYSVIDWASKVSANKSYISSDKVHPSAGGYDTLKNIINNALGSVDKIATAVQGNSNAEKIWIYLIGKGLSPYQVAGIMGNIQAESGFVPDKEEYATGIGYGIVQWSFGRRDALEAYAKQRGIPVSSLELQLDFLWKELTTSYSEVLQEIKQSKSLNEASDIFLKKFEVPADIPGQIPIRRAFGAKILQKYAGISGSISGCDESLTSGRLGWDLEGANRMIYYSQYDPQWKDEPYGIGPIWECGCGPTSMAMIAATLTGDKTITPPVVAKYYYEKGGQIGLGRCGSNWSWQIIANKYNLTMKDIALDYEQAAKILSSGGLVLVSVGTGIFTSGEGHILVMRKSSADQNSFYFADPAESSVGDEHNQKAYSIDTLKSGDTVNGGNITHMWGFIK